MPKNVRWPASCSVISLSMNNRRNWRERSRTDRKKPDRHGTHRPPSGAIPPPGTIMWMCGGHGRPPDMQHGGDTDLGAEMLGIGGNGEHGLGAGLEQQAVNHPFVGFLLRGRGGAGAGNGCGILDRRRTGHLGDFVGKFDLAVVLGPVADLADGIGDAPQAVAVPADPVNNQKRLRRAR